MFARSLPIISLLSIISLRSVSAVDYSETYVGCVSGTGTSGALASPNVNTISDCNYACADAGYTYAYFQYQSAGSYCSCKNVGPSASEITPAVSGNTNCGGAAAGVNALATDYYYNNCYNSPTAEDTTSQSTFDACFERCTTYTNAFVSPAGNVYSCVCSNTASTGTAQNCGVSGTYFAYAHTATSSPSIVERRKRRLSERLKREEQTRLNRFCPAGLEACVIPGLDDSFECIDTSSELESCGGCLYGSTGNSNASTGIDCSTLPGASFGGTTCSAGRCEISACKEGYNLVEGRCDWHV
ncbi:hypothetical protein V865_002724 [Kwoniella europaea PYCC6329]|uniref:WSC domain-containing protein n=1 Tax=Kwoniella europaea PYCC6329 TaxID=1423913 RepID=A0AAX4KFU8_9TREE